MFRTCLLVVGVLTFTLFSSNAASAQRASVSGSEVTGTFRMSAGNSYQNEIKIAALGGGKIRFSMSLYYPYVVRGEAMAHSGGLDGDASIKADTAIYTSEDGLCTMTFKFTKPNVLVVDQKGSDGECGFGVNVYADGTYKKVSGKRPNFDAQ